MRVLIYGAGAIGAWLAAGLAKAGHEITCIARQSFIDSVRHRGLHIEQPDGTITSVSAIKAYASLAQLNNETALKFADFGNVLICVKAYSMQVAIAELSEWRQYSDVTHNASPLFVCLQNGVGSDGIAVDAFGSDHVVAATTTIPISIQAPSVFKVERSGGAICIAPCGSSDTAPLVSLLRDVGPLVKVYADHRSLRWSKLLLNIMGNASSAILDMPVDAIYRDWRTYRIELAMLNECMEVVEHLGVHFTNLPSYPAATFAWALKAIPAFLLQPVLRHQIAKGRGSKRPSLQYDVMNHSGRSEIDWLNGAVFRYGKAIGVHTPVNEMLTRVLDNIVTKRDTQAEWRGNISRLMLDAR